MGLGRGTVAAWIAKRLARLRFPTLFLVMGGLFLVNLVVPDVVPFFDELLMGLATAMLASLRLPKDQAEAAAERSEPSARRGG